MYNRHDLINLIQTLYFEMEGYSLERDLPTKKVLFKHIVWSVNALEEERAAIAQLPEMEEILDKLINYWLDILKEDHTQMLKYATIRI